MEEFDFNAPAEMFAAGGWGPKRRAMKFTRFDTGAEAVRFAIESQDDKLLAGTVIESGDLRLTAVEIRSLYDRADYPFPRAAPAASVVGKPV